MKFREALIVLFPSYAVTSSKYFNMLLQWIILHLLVLGTIATNTSTQDEYVLAYSIVFPH